MSDFDVELFIYERLCGGCRKEKYCHDNCEHCDDYLKELDKFIYDDDRND